MERLKAYIVENPMNHGRYLEAKERLEEVGFQAMSTVVHWGDPELRKHLRSKSLSNRPETFYVAAISNSLAHTRAWERIAKDDSMGSDDWSLVVEDDIRFSPTIPQSEIYEIVETFLRASHTNGFAYLGICAGDSFGEEKQLPGFTSILTKRVFGPCAHAYAIKKQFAKVFYHQILEMCGDEGKLYSYPLDRLLCRYWRRNDGAPLCGINISSPLTDRNNQPVFNEHRGIVYQDRASFKSSFRRLRQTNKVSHSRNNGGFLVHSYRKTRQGVNRLLRLILR